MKSVFKIFLVSLTMLCLNLDIQAQESNLYLNMLLFKGSSEYKDYSQRFFEKDTIINDKSFKKYRWETFKESTQLLNTTYEYEHIGKSSYLLLDEKTDEVHSLNFSRSPQQGKIFYEEGVVIYESIKGNNFPAREEGVYNRYRLKDKEYNYVLFGNGDRVGMTSNEEHVRLLLESADIDMICKALNNKSFVPESPSFQTIGDKIQYEVWNTTVRFSFSTKDSTQESERSYEVKDLITQEYTGDTLINGKKYSKLDIIVKDMKKGGEKVLNSYVAIEADKLVFMNEGEDFAVSYSPSPILTLDSIALIFRGSMEHSFYGKDFTEYILWSATGYETLISFLSVFPCPMIEMWGHDNNITYLKVNGEEYGELK